MVVVPSDKAVFFETGIKVSYWRGRYWARWGDALQEAGFRPNILNAARESDVMLEHLARLVRELGHYPVEAEIRLKRRADPVFPSQEAFRRFGGKAKLASKLREFCERRSDTIVLALIPTLSSDEEASTEAIAEAEFGFVYLLKSGRFYKIGRSNAAGRRERELAIQLPERANLIHSIKTDDPAGIEGYWHRRFDDRRQNGEWFALTAQDIAVFRRRKFM